MATGATIFRVELERSDVDRGLYTSHALTLARHASENDERMMVRLLAFAMFAPPSDDDGALEFGRGVSDDDEPALWRRDLTGKVEHWIELGEPDRRRITQALGRASRVSLVGYRGAFMPWWKGFADEAAGLSRLDVWALDPTEVRALATLPERTMRLSVTLQEGTAWVGSAGRTTPVELRLQRLR